MILACFYGTASHVGHDAAIRAIQQTGQAVLTLIDSSARISASLLVASESSTKSASLIAHQLVLKRCWLPALPSNPCQWVASVLAQACRGRFLVSVELITHLDLPLQSVQEGWFTMGGAVMSRPSIRDGLEPGERECGAMLRVLDALDSRIPAHTWFELTMNAAVD